MDERVLLGMTVIVTLGVGAQWLAWRLRLPSILLLLIFGFVAGPIARWAAARGGHPELFLDPDKLLGPLLLPLVSLSVAIILYEGGLSLSVRDLPKVGGVVRNLVTIGMLVTWLLGAAAAHVIAGLSWPLALLLGAVLVVSGPTVIIPLLGHVRPAGVIGPIIRWEGIVIDPIGATLAVLVYEVAFAAAPGQGAAAAVGGLVRTVVVGGGLGVFAALLLTLAVRRHGVPDFLQNAVSLMLVTATFAAANALQHESGLLAVTVMGVVLANQRTANVRHIIDFKENLRVLLIAVLFILLAARLRLEDFAQLGPASLLFVAVLIVVVRPLATWLATMRTKLTWRERVFLGWMAPRGIVAAAVASVFALRLEADYPEARILVPLTFLVIVTTVTIYGLSSAPLARRLGLADVNPQGLLFVGAQAWARALAEVLQREQVRVLLIDRNHENVVAARLAGLAVYEGNVLGEYVLEEVDLRGIGRLLALTPNDEVNALAVQRFERVFESVAVYQLTPATGRRGQKSVPREMHGRLLFQPDLTHADISQRVFRGGVFHATRLTESFGYGAFRARHGANAVPMFIVRANGLVTVVSPPDEPKPRAGDTLISLGPREDRPPPASEQRAGP